MASAEGHMAPKESPPFSDWLNTPPAALSEGTAVLLEELRASEGVGDIWEGAFSWSVRLE